ncbi:amidohydrolase family protein [Streptosporangium sp. NPDC051023]|uniref:amidohydrolase family protein n=1 Tax=Streptosporangium sp. NPDC051023 TaxID=3155410 RepID=UPI00344CD525
MTGGIPDVTIIDAHVNLATDLAIPRLFLEEQAANIYHRLASFGQSVKPERIADRLFSLHQDHDGDRLVAEMDAAGVEQAFLVAPDFSHVADVALSPPELAELHYKVTRRHPGRFRVFWGVDPRSGPDGVALFERCVEEYGFAGLKLYPPAGYSPSDRRLYPYYELCAGRGIPVLSHTGPGWGPLDFTYGQPLMLDEATRDFPRVNFILGHGGVTHVEESAYMCLHRPNVFLDISQFPGVLSSDGWQAHLNRLFQLSINHKILFGTCWPSFRMSASLESLTKEFREGTTVFAGVRQSHRRLIMAETIRRLAGDGGMTVAAEGLA